MIRRIHLQYMIGKLAPLLTQGLFPRARLMESAGEIKLNL